MARLMLSVVPRLALLGAMTVASLVGGCGRKGQLEPPPSARLAGQNADTAAPAEETEQNPLFASPSEVFGVPSSSASSKQPKVMDQYGQPIAPPGPKRHIPLDYLID